MRKLAEQYRDLPEKPSRKEIAKMTPEEKQKHNDKVLEVMKRAQNNCNDKDEYARFMYNMSRKCGTPEQRESMARHKEGAQRAQDAIDAMNAGEEAMILTREQRKRINRLRKESKKEFVKTIQEGLRDQERLMNN